MLTPAELEKIKEELGDDWARKIEMLLTELEAKRKLEEEVATGIQRIFSDAEAKEYFEKALEKANIKMDIPKTPLDEMKVLKQELNELKQTQEMKERIQKLIETHGLTQEELVKICEFQEKYGLDPVKAIELYVETKKEKEELMPLKRFEPLKRPEEYTEEEAYKRTVKEFQQFLQTLRR